MKKIMLLILFAVFSVSAHAGVLEDCIKKIEDDDANWQQQLFGSAGIFYGIEEGTEITQDVIAPRIEQLHILIAYNVYNNCKSDINIIARKDRGHISFIHDGHKYGLDFSIKKMFDYITKQIGFLVIDRRNLNSGDIVKLSDLPKGEYFYSSDCSDHFIWWNLNDSSPVNVAGQAVFTEFGGSDNEFFLDFPVDNSRRAFPGLVLMEKTGSTTEQIVSYRNLSMAINKIRQFSEKLKNTACANQNLAAYLVILNEKEITQDLGNKFLDIKELKIVDGPYLI